MVFILGSLESKVRSGLPISVRLIELFSLVVTAEALRAKIDKKSAILLQHGHLDPKFQVEGFALLIIFAWIVKLMNVLQLCLCHFSQKKLGSRLSSSKVQC